MATVTLNSGINLQCREYPSPLATSLGLIPNGSNILALGYAGPADPNSGEQNTPVEAGAFAQPESATSFEQIWLQIDWASPEGLVRCWVRSDFARLTLVEEGTARQLIEPADLFALATIEEPVTGRIPSNFNGGHIGTAATAPIIPEHCTSAVSITYCPDPYTGFNRYYWSNRRQYQRDLISCTFRNRCPCHNFARRRQRHHQWTQRR